MTDEPLFPLPLEPFEYYMVSDERPGYPMTIPVRFEVSGEIDREAFREALDETVDSNPLLKSVLKKVRGLGLSWQVVDDWRTPIEWNSGEPSLELNIHEQPGLRVWVREHDLRAEVICVFHHACVDGIAVFRFVGDWLAAYARRTATSDQHVPKDKPLDPFLLRQRAHFPVELPAPIGTGTIVRETLREAYRWLTRPAAPLASPKNGDAAPQDRNALDSLDFIWADLPADQAQRYRETATALGVTLNDLLVRDMFLTVRSWNQTHGPNRQGRWLRITMPTSLRMRIHRKMPVANGISYAFLTRTADDCDDEARLLKGVHAETSFIKDWHVSLMFLNAIAIARRIPFVTSMISRSSRRCYSTTNLSYLGDFPRLFRVRMPKQDDGKILAGNLTLESFYGAPPVRPQTHATLAIIGYRGVLSFCMRVNKVALEPPAGRQFLDAFLRRFKRRSLLRVIPEKNVPRFGGLESRIAKSSRTPRQTTIRRRVCGQRT